MSTSEHLVETLQQFNAKAQLRCGREHFVGAVYDETSPQGAQEVALVVGINYGQHGTSHASVDRSAETIGYAKMVSAITGTGDVHTALWNFHPYLTQKEWLSEVRNAADEAERIFSRGYVDPIETFATLVDAVAPKHLIFHGVGSAVPLLARVALRRVGRSGILVRNLSRGYAAGSKREIS